MNIEQLGAWGELIGGIASLIAALGVVGSLIFVGLQIRHSAAATRGAVRQSISDAQQSYYSLSLLSPGLVNARAVVNEYPGTITDGPEPWQAWLSEHGGFTVYDPLRVWGLCYWRLMENAHFQYQTRLLDEEEWAPFVKGIEQSLNGRQVSQRFIFEALRERGLLRPAFRDFAEQLIDDDVRLRTGEMRIARTSEAKSPAAPSQHDGA